MSHLSPVLQLIQKVQEQLLVGADRNAALGNVEQVHVEPRFLAHGDGKVDAG
jgi:hypothetical protein